MNNYYNSRIVLRYRILFVFLVLVFLILLFRAYQLIFHSPLPLRLSTQIENVRRGSIVDKRNFELAISLDTISVAAQPKKIINKHQTAFLLSEVLPLSEDQIMQKLESKENFVWLLRKIPTDEERAIKKLNLPGIVIQVEPSRRYPNGHLASTVLGFVGMDNEGLSGLEFYYNNDLTSRKNDALVGNNIQLTIDSYIQYQMERVLKAEMEKNGSRAAVGIISQVNTGEILAMASLPDFDPNQPLRFPKENYRNRAISEQYEPGSVFKIFTIASLMRSGLFDEDKTFSCDGIFKYKNVEVRDPTPRPRQNMRGVIKHSCNSGLIEAAWEMPVEIFYKNLQYFGFGSRTEIGLPGEEKGILHPPESWDIFFKATIPIGHGIAVTPIQLITAANSIANGGLMLKPIIVKKITSTNNRVLKETPVQQLFKLNSKLDAQKIMSYLTSVVEGGTGAQAAISNFSTAGKTGTSIKSDGVNYIKKYQASFVGFFPAENPEVSIFIWFDEPQGTEHQGGTVAAPAFRQILLDILPVVHKGHVHQTRKISEWQVTSKDYSKTEMPNLMNMSKKEVLLVLAKYYKGEHNLQGAGYIKKQNPPAGTTIEAPYSFDLFFGFE